MQHKTRVVPPPLMCRRSSGGRGGGGGSSSSRLVVEGPTPLVARANLSTSGLFSLLPLSSASEDACAAAASLGSPYERAAAATGAAAARSSATAAFDESEAEVRSLLQSLGAACDLGDADADGAGGGGSGAAAAAAAARPRRRPVAAAAAGGGRHNGRGGGAGLSDEFDEEESDDDGCGGGGVGGGARGGTQARLYRRVDALRANRGQLLRRIARTREERAARRTVDCVRDNIAAVAAQGQQPAATTVAADAAAAAVPCSPRDRVAAEASQRRHRARCRSAQAARARRARDEAWMRLDEEAAALAQEKAEAAERRRRCEALLQAVALAASLRRFDSVQRAARTEQEAVRARDEAARVLQGKLLPLIRLRANRETWMTGAKAALRRLSAQRRQVLERKEAGAVLVLHLLRLAEGCVQVRARLARSRFMGMVRRLQTFTRAIVMRKRLQYSIFEMQWKLEEASQIQRTRAREMQGLKEEFERMLAWREAERKEGRGGVGQRAEKPAAWREGLRWDHPQYTLLSSMLEMRANHLPDADLRQVACDVGYLQRSAAAAVPAHLRREVLHEELRQRRRAYYSKIPLWRDAVDRWEKRREMLTDHITHDVEDVRAKLLQLAGVSACPAKPEWAVVLPRAHLCRLIKDSAKVARQNAATAFTLARDKPQQQQQVNGGAGAAGTPLSSEALSGRRRSSDSYFNKRLL